MLYTIDSNADEPIMLINTHIGFNPEDGMGVDGAAFQQELLYIDSLGKKRIQVWINSIGGNVMQGYSIFSAILKSKTPVDTYNVGICASIAAVIFMAGRKRIMMDYSLAMVHNPFSLDGTGDDETLLSMRRSVTTMMASKSGLSEDEVSNLMNGNTWMGSADCLKYGFATEIEVTNEHNRHRMPLVEPKEMMATANSILNSTLNKTNNMKKVAMFLQLNPDAGEDAILAAVQAAVNKVPALERERDAVTLQRDEFKTTAETAQAKVTELETAQATAAKAQLHEKAVTMVASYVKAGRIKNSTETVNKWVALAEADLKGTEDLIKDLPLNKKADSIIEKVESVENAGYSAAMVMAEVQNKLSNKTNK